MPRNGRWTKEPIQCDGSAASSTNPETWTDYEHATGAFGGGMGDGLGFVFAMWMTRRKDCDIDFAAARDEGLKHLDQIITERRDQ